MNQLAVFLSLLDPYWTYTLKQKPKEQFIGKHL